MKSFNQSQKLIKDIFLKFQKEKSIVSLHADINYTLIRLKNGKSLVSSYTLKFFQENLNQSEFLRVNRSTMVSHTHIQGLFATNKGYFLKLAEGKKQKISRRREVEILERLSNRKTIKRDEK